MSWKRNTLSVVEYTRRQWNTLESWSIVLQPTCAGLPSSHYVSQEKGSLQKLEYRNIKKMESLDSPTKPCPQKVWCFCLLSRKTKTMRRNYYSFLSDTTFWGEECTFASRHTNLHMHDVFMCISIALWSGSQDSASRIFFVSVNISQLPGITWKFLASFP